MLSSCNIALQQGRYRWRHDKVLEAISSVLEPVVTRACHKQPSTLRFINFVKPGQQKVMSNTQLGVLQTANDWLIRIDLKKRLQFPGEIVQTTLRPDIVIWSTKSRQLIMIELTVPWEENIEMANERKRLKYDELTQSCEAARWKTWCLPIEVGCRGFIGNSIWAMCKILGIGGKNRKSIRKLCEEKSERASNWIWIKRNDREWVTS